MDVVGGYELVGRVAAGPSGTLWRARDPRGGRDLAIKQVSLQAGAALTRLRASARVLADLSHPNVIDVVGLVEERQYAWLIEEWIDGVSLAGLSSTMSPLTPPQALGVVRQVVSGLAHAHAQAVVHGDVSPANVMVDGSGAAKLIDFGLVPASGLSGIWGTPGYLCPEAAAGRPASPRGDVYSAGAVLAALLLGRPVFADEGARARPPGSAGPDLSGIDENIGIVLQRALSVDPRARYADGEQLGAALDMAAEGTFGSRWPAIAALPTQSPPRTPRPARRASDSLASLPSPSGAPVAGAEPAPRGSQVMVGSGGGAHRSGNGPADDFGRIRRPRADPLAPRPAAPVTGGLRARVVNAFRVPGRLSATGAAVVVILAISILVVMHATGTTSASQAGFGGASPATTSVPAGRVFTGTYDVTETLTSPGVGPDAGDPPSYVRHEKWVVTSNCDPVTGRCSATVTADHEETFTLALAQTTWAGPVTPDDPCPTARDTGYMEVFESSSVATAGDTMLGDFSPQYDGCSTVGGEHWSLKAKRTSPPPSFSSPSSPSTSSSSPSTLSSSPSTLSSSPSTSSPSASPSAPSSPPLTN